MKVVMRILLLAVVFYVSLLLISPDSSVEAQDLQEQLLQERLNKSKPTGQENTFETVDEKNPDTEDDEFVPYYEHDLILDKLYKKKMPPMSRKEKIVWSFRMADTNFFL